MSIRNKLILYLLLISSIPLVIFGLIETQQIQRVLSRQVAESTLETLHLFRASVNVFIYGKLENIRLWAKDKDFRTLISNHDRSAIISFSEDWLKKHQEYTFASYITSRGELVTTFPLNRLKSSKLDLGSLGKALTGEETFSDQIVFNEITMKHELYVYEPIFEENSATRVLGVLIVGLSWEIVTNMISGLMNHNIANHFMLFDQTGLAISGYNKDRFGGNLIEEGVLSARKAVEGQEGYLIENTEHDVLSFTVYTFFNRYRDMPQLKWYLSFYQDPERIFDLIRQQYQLILFQLLISLVTLTVISIVIGRKIGNPILQIAQSAQKIGKGDFTHKVPYQSQDEIGILSKAFNKMVDNLYSANRELKYAKEKAEFANQSKTYFLANVSHEIRTPLNAISGFSQIIMNHTQSMALPPDMLQYLKNIHISTQNLSELINNVLDLSKIEAGKMSLHYEDLNLKIMIQSLFQIHKAQAAQKGITLNYKLEPQVPTIIHSDRTKINQFLINLLNNAIKFTPTGKEIQFNTLLENNLLVFQIIDKGIGIPENRLEAIFEAFEQADNTITRKYGGTGLGLAITKQIIALLGGTIHVESLQGQGSTFTVKIPLISAVHQNLAEEQVKFEKIAFSPENVILVVEDHALNQEVIKTLFKELKLEIHLANNGIEAINMVKTLHTRQQIPDLILMDLHMPEMDGAQAIKNLRQIPEFSEIPIVLLSADIFYDQDKFEGVNDFLNKPIEFNELIQVLTRYLRREAHAAPAEISVKDPLPDSVEQDLLEKLEYIFTIPIYYPEKILETLEEMQSLCAPYQSKYTPLIEKLMQLAFASDETNLRNFIEEITDGKNSDSR
ncbi:ATP-binding protein [Deltaproteobacteria bacterium TL4]